MAKVLIVKLLADNDIEAYRVVSRLGFRFVVMEADYDSKNFKFEKGIKNKETKDFLKNDFGK